MVQCPEKKPRKNSQFQIKTKKLPNRRKNQEPKLLYNTIQASSECWPQGLHPNQILSSPCPHFRFQSLQGKTSREQSMTNQRAGHDHVIRASANGKPGPGHVVLEQLEPSLLVEYILYPSIWEVITNCVLSPWQPNVPRWRPLCKNVHLRGTVALYSWENALHVRRDSSIFSN